MSKPKEILFSLSDFIDLLRASTLLVLAVSFFFAALLFCYLLTKPVSFTAEGIFKSPQAHNSSPILTALQFFSAEEKYMPNDEPRSFLRSFSVLSQVVSTLNLQATLVGNPMPGRLKEIWYTLKTACREQRLKRVRPASQILSGEVVVCDHLIIPDLIYELICSQVNYGEETSTHLKITWLDESNYKVKKGNWEIGRGQKGIPFHWEKGSFTLIGTPNCKKTYSLHLIPLEAAVLSLQNSIQVIRDKENSSLLRVSFTHRDRHLAARIVNEVMNQFELYLQSEGTKKITKQLCYLQQRQIETGQLLEEVLEKHKTYLENHLDTGAIISLEKELEFMTERQSVLRQEMLDVQTEIMYLTEHRSLFPEMLITLAQERAHQPLQSLTIEGVRALIRSRQDELDQLYYKRDRYTYSLQKLREAQFEAAALVELLNLEPCRLRFETIAQLQHRLVDSKNWSAKEREQLKTELETEKHSLMQQVTQLIEGTEIQVVAVQERIVQLKKNLLYLLVDRYHQNENSLMNLAQQAANFPQKWLAQQKIELNTQLYKQMMVSITEIIEAKNIGYHLDYLLASSFKKARPPLIPRSTRLFLGTLLGAGLGVFFVLLGLSCYIIWRGPSASTSHLKSLGKRVLPEKETIQFLSLELASAGPIILIASQAKIPFFPSLPTHLSKMGKKVYVIDFSSILPPDFLAGEERDTFFASERFRALLASYKEHYDTVLMLAHYPQESFAFKILATYADLIVFSVTTERVQQLNDLPPHTLFYTAQHLQPQLVLLKAVKPRLDRLMDQMKHASASLPPSEWPAPLKKL